MPADETESATAEAGSGSTDFDADLPYRLAPTVSLRPEPFGALVYDFTTRRLSFLKTQTLVTVVRALESQPSAREALVESSVPTDEQDRYLNALAGLLSAGTIVPRDTEGQQKGENGQR